MLKEWAKQVCEEFGRQSKKANNDTGTESKQSNAESCQGSWVGQSKVDEAGSLLAPVVPDCDGIVLMTACSSVKESRLLLGGGGRDTAHPADSEDTGRKVLSDVVYVTEWNSDDAVPMRMWVLKN